MSELSQKLTNFQQSIIDTLIVNIRTQLYNCACPACLKEQAFFDRATSGQGTEEEIKTLISMAVHNKSKISSSLRHLMAIIKTLTGNDVDIQIKQLIQAYGEDRIEIKEDCICYTTQPIILETVELGRFVIYFNEKLLQSTVVNHYTQVYVEALDPNEMVKDNVHPHVSGGNTVCLGDYVDSISAAVSSLDLISFFEMVEAILNTYNPDSPYVPIEAWRGYECKDCGTFIREDEKFYCEGCDNYYCQNCIVSCDDCGTSSCSSCYSQDSQTQCPICSGDRCHYCIEDHWHYCNGCDKHICEDCGVSECEVCGDSFCSNCRKVRFCSECETSVCDRCECKCKDEQKEEEE